jgi:uncharacterized protein (TIGR00297 family)
MVSFIVNEISGWLIVGVFLFALMGLLLRFLTISGFVASLFVGGCIAFSLRWQGLIVLAVFFVSSSLWSIFKKEEKKEAEEKSAKSSKRDWQQVLANGGLAALLAVFSSFNPSIVYVLAFVASMAASNADTWASEIGTLSKKSPISMRTFHYVEKGTSGAISLIGTMGGLLGALTVSTTGFLVFDNWNWSFVAWITLFGFIGHFVDTFIGAFVQVEYVCKICERKTESPFHCGTNTIKMKGIAWMNNEAVNFFCAASSACLTFIFFQ